MSLSPSGTSQNTAAITRLTALWALAESGLGGVLFALKLPFTGFLIGAVSVIILSFIARLSGNSAKAILGATVLVLLVKAGASPHSPPAAYLAVAFQGCLAALLFFTTRRAGPAAVLLGAISMAESAGQKLILLTLVFGASFWNAVEQFAGSIAKIFGRQSFEGSAAVIGGIYLALYALWGVAVGLVAARLPARLERDKEAVLAAYRQSDAAAIGTGQTTRRRRRKKVVPLLLFGVLLAGILFFLHSTGKSRIDLMLLFGRSIAVLLLLFFVVRPLAKMLFAKWVSRRSAEKQKEVSEIVSLLPQLRSHVKWAWQSATPKRGFRKMGPFLRTVLILTLYADETI